MIVTEKLRASAMAAKGCYSDAALDQAADCVAKVQAAGLETLRLVFPDQHGILRGKTIVADALSSAFCNGLGVPSTLLLKDTAHRTVFPVWQDDVTISDLPLGGAGDVLLAPDPFSFHPLPWAPHSALILCDVYHRSGAPVPFASRTVLDMACDRLAKAGYGATFGLEVEFQVFERIDPALDHADATMPPAPVQTRNINQGHQYLTETRYADAEDLLDTLRRMSQEMGLAPRSMEIEMGPSQFEFTFDPSDPKTQANRFVLFRTMVKEVCHAKGLHATFMAKPKLPNAAANGWHIHQSLQETKTGRNVFTPNANSNPTPEASAWIAGLLDNAAASCLLTNPTVNSYKRFQPFKLAPNRIQWGADNRGAMLRSLFFADDAGARIENRVPDTTANPYFAFAAQILCGLDGLSRNALAPAPTHQPYAQDAAHLPQSLLEAIDAFSTSAFYKECLGIEFVDYLTRIKRAEWDRYLMTVSEWEQREYFNLF